MADLAGLHPFPTGWYAVAFSKDLEPGELKTVHYFDKDIVLFRTEGGEAVAIEPFCPHLGAHFGHGGEVEGESLRCPFHHWRFAADGACVEIPGCSKLPRQARLDRYPVKEQDDVVFVFHSAGGKHRDPFPFPPLGGEGFTPSQYVEWTLRTHPQEVCENTVDMAHLRPIHSVEGAHVINKPHIDGSHMNVVLEFLAPGDLIDMPGEDNDVQLDVIIDGLGRIVSRTHVKNVGVRARQAIYCTPIDGEKMHLRGVVNTMATDDPEFTGKLAELFFESFVSDFAKDFPIWENKRYRDRPVLSAADGPVGMYRRWSRQFYPDEAEQDRSAASSSPRRRPRLLEVLQERVHDVVDRGRTLIGARRSGANGSEDGEWTNGSSSVSARSRAAQSASRPIASVAEYFDTLDERFAPEGAAGIDAVFQWKLSGDGGGTRHAVVRNGAMSLHEGEHADPTVTISMSASDYVRMVNKEIDGARAFTSGRAKLSGSVPMAMKMRKIFPN
jgi:nitrite reductase/ring-hydroxylating ferredoxin subunit/putative sterol carrier protein